MPIYHHISEWPEEKVAVRIISLVPSITELLFALGLNDEVIGITKFCTQPEAWFRTKQRIGGTKNARVAEILALHPDLVIANKEENVEEQVKAMAAETDVWVTDIKTLEDALQMIQEAGIITGKQAAATNIILNIKKGFAQLPVLNHRLKVGYLIWRNPYMAAGGDTFIHDMLSQMGLDNIYGQMDRYPEVSLQALVKDPPDVLLLSSEPYPFGAKHMAEIREWLPATLPVLVDGACFSWYGSRLLEAPDYFGKLIKEWNQTF